MITQKNRPNKLNKMNLNVCCLFKNDGSDKLLSYEESSAFLKSAFGI